MTWKRTKQDGRTVHVCEGWRIWKREHGNGWRIENPDGGRLWAHSFAMAKQRAANMQSEFLAERRAKAQREEHERGLAALIAAREPWRPGLGMSWFHYAERIVGCTAEDVRRMNEPDTPSVETLTEAITDHIEELGPEAVAKALIAVMPEWLQITPEEDAND